MNSRKILKWHIRAFKMCGLWPPEDESISYSFYTVVFSTFVIAGFPISQLICVLYVDSINAIVDHLVLTSTVLMASIKAFNVLIKRKVFTKLLHLMCRMDERISDAEEKSIFRPLFIDLNRMLLIFFIDYMLAWILVAMQVMMSPPKTRIWSSTFLYPVELLHQPNIYIGGIIFQAISNLLLVIVAIAVDTYGASLLHVLGGHLNVLGSHIRNLGQNDFKSTAIDRKAVLVDICEKYISIIEYSKFLENILSFALFSQFGVSGLVLCTCAYQLSVVSPIEDTSKFIFCAVYSFGMIIEIFVPSYFGSVLSIKSQKMTYDIFESGWINSSENEKKMLQMLGERTLRPISIYAEGIFKLNLTTMLKILKTAYSLFALLKNVQN